MKRIAIVILAVAAGSGCTPHISGLMPVTPSPTNGRTDSVQPLLQWEALVITDARVSDVVYDLEVCTEDGNPVYQRSGLTNPEHQVQEPLASKTRYRWRVRARFRWEGKRRETQWSSVVSGSGASPLGMLLVTP